MVSLPSHLIPGAQNGTVDPTGNASYATVTSVITYDNASNSVTLHFNRPMNPDYVFDSLSVIGFGYGIVDAKYAASVGAGFSQSNWYTWEQEVNPADYNTAMQFKPVGIGPFMLQSYTPGQSAVLVPNPHYGGVPGIPAVNFTVVINYVKVPETALLQLEDGQADSVGGLNGLPPSDFPILNSLQSQGIVDIHTLPISEPVLLSLQHLRLQERGNTATWKWIQRARQLLCRSRYEICLD